MNQRTPRFDYENMTDAAGSPTGGFVSGTGINIRWQDGPLGIGVDAKEPNGCFVEDIISAARIRLQHYQNSPFDCYENEMAMLHLEFALSWLNKRTADRVSRGVEGTGEK